MPLKKKKKPINYKIIPICPSILPLKLAHNIHDTILEKTRFLDTPFLRKLATWISDLACFNFYLIPCYLFMNKMKVNFNMFFLCSWYIGFDAILILSCYHQFTITIGPIPLNCTHLVEYSTCKHFTRSMYHCTKVCFWTGSSNNLLFLAFPWDMITSNRHTIPCSCHLSDFEPA